MLSHMLSTVYLDDSTRNKVVDANFENSNFETFRANFEKSSQTLKRI